MPGPDAGRVVEYADTIEMLFQQRIARLRNHVQLKTGVRGTMCSFDLIGPSDMEDITGIRAGSTAWSDIDSLRRWAPKRDYSYSPILARGDRLAMITDAQGAYVRNGVAAANRKLDKVLIDAATATAQSGENGTSTVPFDTASPNASGGGGNQIAAGGTGLTIAKMRTARGVFLARDVGVDEMQMGVSPRFVWVMTGWEMQELLAETEATSTDFLGDNGQRMPLVEGMIPRYLGFDLIVSNQLNTSAGSRVNLAWHADAMGFAVWSGGEAPGAGGADAQSTASFTTFVGMLPEHNLATGIIVQGNFGAVRVQDKGVLSVLCTGTVP